MKRFHDYGDPMSYEMECPECGGDVELDSDVMVGEIVPCEECGAELEVTKGDPFALQVAPEEEEDWGE